MYATKIIINPYDRFTLKLVLSTLLCNFTVNINNFVKYNLKEMSVSSNGTTFK